MGQRTLWKNPKTGTTKSWFRFICACVDENEKMAAAIDQISSPEPPLLLSSGWGPVPVQKDRGLWERDWCQPRCMASTPRMRTAISLQQWQPWTAFSSLLGIISMAQSARSQRLSDVRLFKLEIGAAQPRSVTEIAPKSSFLCVNTIGLDQFCSKMSYSAGRMLALEIAYSARNSLS